MRGDGSDELPRVTKTLLRQADEMCPRRLALEHGLGAGGKPAALGTRGFEVANRLHEDAVKAHIDADIPAAAAFVDPAELEPEQRALYAAAVRGYLARFGADPVRADDLGFDTEVPEVGVRLVGPVGLSVRDELGRKELRLLAVGGRRRLVDDVDLHFAVLRAAAWAPDRLRIVAVDLVHDTSEEHEVDVTTAHVEALEWLRARVEVIRRRVDVERPKVGADCKGCAFVPGCAPLTAGTDPRGGGRVRAPKKSPLGAIARLTPSSYAAYVRCPRSFFLEHLLRIPESDESRSPDHGLLVHELLHAVHDGGSCHDDEHVASTLAAHGADHPELRAFVERHRDRCPRSIDRAAHEVTRARFHRAPAPMFLASARVDAVWVHDEMLDVRDYKTGGRWVDELADDPAARVQAWVLATDAARRGLRLRLRYEYLAPEVDDDPPPWEPDDDDVEAIGEELRAAVARMWDDDGWRGVAAVDVCSSCRYRSVCRDSAAPAEPGWAALAIS